MIDNLSDKLEILLHQELGYKQLPYGPDYLTFYFKSVSFQVFEYS